MTYPFMDTTPPEPMPGADDKRGAIPIAVPIAPGNSVLIGGACILKGFGIVETSGAAGAYFELWSGGVDIGIMVMPVRLLANESRAEWFSPEGILCNGLSLDFDNGAILGAVYVLPL